MKVAELQDFLGHVVTFARTAGASEKVVTELSRTLVCLDPFKAQTLTAFNDLLRLADEYYRTGKLTPAATSGARKPRAGKMSVDDAVAIFKDLEGRATDPTLTFPEIEAKFKPIGNLTVPQLKELASKVGATLYEKSKAGIVTQLKGQITELKASFDRTQQYRFGA